MYHGTSEKNARSILREGFNRDLSKDGMLGRGIYCSRDRRKAEQYGSVLLVLDVRCGWVKKYGCAADLTSNRCKNWHNEGFDCAWVPPGVNRSGLEENCVWDPSRITVVGTIGLRTNVAVSITGYADRPNHTVYFIETECDLNGTRLRFTSQQRFSAFAQLHETLRQGHPAMARGLPHDFPVPKELFNFFFDRLKRQRRDALEQYLRVAVNAATHAGLPPELATFLGM